MLAMLMPERTPIFDFSGSRGAVMGPSNEMCQEWIGRTLVGMDLGFWKQSEELPKKA